MEMLTIVELERGADRSHALQAQSGRRESWLEGWAVLPEMLRPAFDACGGWCELAVEDGVVTGIAPDESTPASLYAAIARAREEEVRLKEELAATDYRVLKCYESALLGQEPPYDVAGLTGQRQALRDAVNAAQQARSQAQEKISVWLTREV